MGGYSSVNPRDYDWRDNASVTKRSAQSYAADDKRVYSGGRDGIKSPVGVNIATKSTTAELIILDVTGSMKNWPEMILEKLPTLYEESNAAILGYSAKDLASNNGANVSEELEISLSAIADTHGDDYPLQVSDFKKKMELIEVANKIRIGGGGLHDRDKFTQESYELAAYFMLHHCKTPNVRRPVCIIAGDEGFYSTVSPEDVRTHIGDSISIPLGANSVMRDLAKRFDVYILRPEPTYSPSMYADIHKQWETVLGPEKVLRMDDPRRLVDTIIAINGYATNHWKQSKELLERRQSADQVDQVVKTLHPLLAAGGKKQDRSKAKSEK
jgi:hypothetical protein